MSGHDTQRCHQPLQQHQDPAEPCLYTWGTSRAHQGHIKAPQSSVKATLLLHRAPPHPPVTHGAAGDVHTAEPCALAAAWKPEQTPKITPRQHLGTLKAHQENSSYLSKRKLNQNNQTRSDASSGGVTRWMKVRKPLSCAASEHRRTKDKDKAKHAQSCLSMENQDQDLMNSVLGKGRLDPAQSWISGACLGELL